MATISAILVPAQGQGGIESVTKQTIAPAASGAEIALGNNMIFAIVGIPVGTPGAATAANINVQFGPVGLGAATAANFAIPVGQIVTLDTSDSFRSIRVFNNCTTTNVDVYVMKLSRV